MINEIEYNADRVRQEQETACRQNLEPAMQHLLKPSRIRRQATKLKIVLSIQTQSDRVRRGRSDARLGQQAVVQAGTVSVLLAPSQCQEHAYELWLYGVPLIISTNTWDATADEWLPANSILVPVDSLLWVGR